MAKARILIADTGAEFLGKARDVLVEAGYEVLTAEDGEQARQLVVDNKPDGVIANVVLPRLDGLGLCALLSEQHETIPCYLVIPHDGPAAIAECIEAGARNVLVKPLKRTELEFAARSLANLSSLLRARVGSGENGRARVPPPPGGDADARARFFQFELFKRIVSMELKRAKRYSFPLSILLLSPDGGPAGGTVNGFEADARTTVGRAIRFAIRDLDFPVQFSEDHILVLMPHTNLDGARVVAERIRKKAHTGDGQAGVSIGAASLDGEGRASFDQLIGRATRALRDARRAGGNCVRST